MINYSIDIKKLLGVIDNNVKINGVEEVTCSKHEDSPLPPKVLFKISSSSNIPLLVISCRISINNVRTKPAK